MEEIEGRQRKCNREGKENVREDRLMWRKGRASGYIKEGDQRT